MLGEEETPRPVSVSLSGISEQAGLLHSRHTGLGQVAQATADEQKASLCSQ